MSVALVPKAMTILLHWQVFWLTQLFWPSHPDVSEQWHSSKKRFLSLQLREQLRILTGFPFHPYLFKKELQEPIALQMYGKFYFTR